MKLSDFSVLSFDCYGTLIDWETGIINSLRSLRSGLSRDVSNESLLELHARFESNIQKENPTLVYREVLRKVFLELARHFEYRAEEQEAQNHGKSVANWRPFPDTVDSLNYLSEYFQLVILSNVDHYNFKRTQELLETEFDYIYLAEDIGTYKPDLNNFAYMLSDLEINGVSSSDVLHTAESVYHDHLPANQLGLSNCWIHRRYDKTGFGATAIPETEPVYDFRFRGLAEFVEAHKLERE